MSAKKNYAKKKDNEISKYVYVTYIIDGEGGMGGAKERKYSRYATACSTARAIFFPSLLHTCAKDKSVRSQLRLSTICLFGVKETLVYNYILIFSFSFLRRGERFASSSPLLSSIEFSLSLSLSARVSRVVSRCTHSMCIASPNGVYRLRRRSRDRL